MCAVGFDGHLPLASFASFGWQGENASPSLQQKLHYDDDEASKLETDSYLLNAKLLLTDEFEELEVHSRVSIALVKLFLTDSEIIVAKLTEDFLSRKTVLTHLRTHSIKEVDIEADPDDPSVMCLTTRSGRRFCYRIRRGAGRVASWMNRFFRIRRNSVSPSSAGMSTLEERQDEQQSYSLPVSRPMVYLYSPSVEEHHSHLPHVPSYESESDSNTPRPHGLSNSATVPDEDETKPSTRLPNLKRRKAFRNSDLDSFLTSNGRTRSSSAPPEEKPEETQATTNTTIPSDLMATFIGDPSISTGNSFNPFESPVRHSSLRKGKLKISPRANRFSRALSARIIHTPVDSSSDERSVEVRRAKSLNTSSSTLPHRSSKNKGKKEPRSKAKSALFDINTLPTPGTPTKPPKSPGSILKIFHRRSGTSSFNLEEFMSSMEEQELLTVDVHNKPKQLKLYLQQPRELAEELTLIDAEMFRKIELTELQNGAWTKKTKVAWLYVCVCLVCSQNLLNHESFTNLQLCRFL